MKKPLLISVGGPTAVGKTATSIRLAEEFSAEILSFDSRQFYHEMTIGSAVPDVDELNRVPHHFVQDRSVQNPLTAGTFEEEALKFLNNYFQKHSILIAVGGSGLYEKALVEGIHQIPDIPDNIVQNLEKKLETKGLSYLQNELKIKDLHSYKTLDVQNSRRLIRALAVYEHTGIPISEWHQNQKIKPRQFRHLLLGLNMGREMLYNRINARVDKMILQGLVDEAKTLEKYHSTKPLQTVGYREVFAYFNGKLTHEQMVNEIKKNTRRYAKRQVTWFKNQTNRTWFEPDSITDIIAKCRQFVDTHSH